MKKEDKSKIGEKKMSARDDETGVLRKKKISRLEKYREEIEGYLKLGISIASMQKILNSKYNLDYVYTTYIHYVRNILKS